KRSSCVSIFTTRSPIMPTARPTRNAPHLLPTAVLTALAVLALGTASPAVSFCGFYVAKADASLFNDSSEVAMVRDGDRTVLTMSNDYKGDLQEFALVVPVPAVLQKGQIHVGDRKL